MSLARISAFRPVEVVRDIVGDIPEIATPLFTAAAFPCCRSHDLFAPIEEYPQRIQRTPGDEGIGSVGTAASSTARHQSTG
jgi:hypothetical protein